MAFDTCVSDIFSLHNWSKPFGRMIVGQCVAGNPLPVFEVLRPFWGQIGAGNRVVHRGHSLELSVLILYILEQWIFVNLVRKKVTPLELGGGVLESGIA